MYWDKSSNNFGVGLPPSLGQQQPLDDYVTAVGEHRSGPVHSRHERATAHLRETLRLRKSDALFRLTTEADINARISHYNTDNSKDALIVMRLSDEVAPDLDAAYENILVFFNANKIQQTYTMRHRPTGLPFIRCTPMA